MARTRKGKQAVRSGGPPGWLLLVIGIVIGAGGMSIVYFTGHMPISRQAKTPQPSSSTTQSGSQAGIAAAPRQKKPRYDFYSVLPEKEVRIPDKQIDAQAKAEQQQTDQSTAASATAHGSTTKPPDGGYVLQVGSFSKASGADALKAKLALKGFRAHIENAPINGHTWSQVRLGPYTSASKLKAVKHKLEADGIHAIALKEK